MTSINSQSDALAAALLEEALACRMPVPVLGISGLPGSGKSTLARQLVAAGRRRGLRVVALSLDDFYLTRRQRQALARHIHPLLATRGPPGSHDLALLHDRLDALLQWQPGSSLALPRFDKLRDRRLPPSHWPRQRQPPRVIVLEGWCLGVPPENGSALAEPLNAVERDEDPDGRWRHYCNAALAGYQPLWRRIDRLVLLQAPDIDVLPAWRGQQERAAQAARPGAPGMDPAALLRFVQLFERIGRQALRSLPELADRVIRLDAERRPLDDRIGGSAAAR